MSWPLTFHCLRCCDVRCVSSESRFELAFDQDESIWKFVENLSIHWLRFDDQSQSLLKLLGSFSRVKFCDNANGQYCQSATPMSCKQR